MKKRRISTFTWTVVCLLRHSELCQSTQMVYALPEQMQPHMSTAVRTLFEWFGVEGKRISMTKNLFVLFDISTVLLVQDALLSAHIMQRLVFVIVSGG